MYKFIQLLDLVLKGAHSGRRIYIFKKLLRCFDLFKMIVSKILNYKIFFFLIAPHPPNWTQQNMLWDSGMIELFNVSEIPGVKTKNFFKKSFSSMQTTYFYFPRCKSLGFSCFPLLHIAIIGNYETSKFLIT